MAEGNKDRLRMVAESTEQFANNFLKEVANRNPGNLIASPLSAQVVLAMAAYGAGGTTAAQMHSALRIPSDKELGLSGYQFLIETLNAAKGVELRLANKIYTSIHIAVKPAYKALTATKFLSSNQEVDFNDAKGTANIINAWCEQKTNNRIKDVISPGSLTSETRLVLVNAVYFKGEWEEKFNPLLTRERAFHADGYSNITVALPTMFIKKTLRLGELPDLRARFIDVPYQGREISMIIILPNEIDGLETVLDNLHRVNLSQSLQRGVPREVEVYLPKFKTESDLNLQQPLENLGMTEMFQDRANFSGMADIPLKVSKVVQKAFIEVNEEGSEAAAVTGMIFATTSLIIDEPPPVVFRVDRPFYYLIYHKRTNVTLFSGVIHRPGSADISSANRWTDVRSKFPGLKQPFIRH